MLQLVVFVMVGVLLHFSTQQIVPPGTAGCVTTDCKNGECIKNDPRYPEGYCQCNWGYKLSTLDKSVCVDRDECALADRLVCGGGLCRNTMGGFYCDCFRGYTPTMYRTYCQSRYPRAQSSMGQTMMNMAFLRRLLDM
ncbi:growth arrest-specific protein 6-like [Gigantopelta aegis]|uniref:growth arrest-specific protein 6-like n=1 Tax=Gigantopelta aegis TaxID=1735272 RepID=UPI001B88A1E0|nr:growth arrest-specific protein 6-like [Gigantopelta aegis]